MFRYALAFVMVAVMATSVVAASEAQTKKCNAIPWGEPLSAVEQLEFDRSAEGINYYKVTKVEACGISAIEDTRVTYAFKDGKLFATIVEIDKARDVQKVVTLLMDEYGLPDHKKDEGWDVYKWSTDTLKIKLKSQYMTDRIKIGMYYKPLISE